MMSKPTFEEPGRLNGVRAYWGQPGILDGSWKPPVIRAVM
jgi:hypothetical protein